MCCLNEGRATSGEGTAATPSASISASKTAKDYDQCTERESTAAVSPASTRTVSEARTGTLLIGPLKLRNTSKFAFGGFNSEGSRALWAGGRCRAGQTKFQRYTFDPGHVDAEVSNPVLQPLALQFRPLCYPL